MPKKLTITTSTFYRNGNVTNLPIARIFRKFAVMQFVSSRFPFVVLTILAFAWIGPSAQGGTCCVWRVTSVPQPFYLVGTVHALTSTDYPLPKPYRPGVTRFEATYLRVQSRTTVPDRIREEVLRSRRLS